MKRLNCNAGNYQCGGKCQPNTNKCPKNLDSGANSIVDSVTSGISKINNNIDTLTEYFDNLPEEQREIYPQNLGIFENDVGALGMQAYFSEDYPLINKYFYDPKYREVAPQDIKMKAEAAEIGFKQMPIYSKEEIQEHYSAKGIEYDGATLYRGMAVFDPDFFNDFVNKHEEGSTIEYPSFTSTSVANPNASNQRKVDGGWGNKPIQVVIKQKERTTSKWVDRRKRKKDEGEMLYPPGQRFMVEKVEKVEIEKLPPRLRDPLKDIFKSTDEGFGIDNLSLRAILGGLSPSEIMTNPEFAWIKDLLKKRGLPDLATLDTSTKLKDILALSKHRGGKSSFYAKASQSLLNVGNIQDSERTNEKEILSAKIYLKEV